MQRYHVEIPLQGIVPVSDGDGDFWHAAMIQTIDGNSMAVPLISEDLDRLALLHDLLCAYREAMGRDPGAIVLLVVEDGRYGLAAVAGVVGLVPYIVDRLPFEP